jgi:cytoskeletal protein RodZ
VAIIIIGLGWWYFAMQSTTTSTPTTTNTTTTQPTQSSQKVITSFSFAALSPKVTVSINSPTNTIMATVPKGTNVTTLTPTIVVSDLATVSPASGKVQDFTNPVTYTVTAQDGSTQAYTVTVAIATDSVKISSKAAIGQFLTDAKGMTLYYF